ncbi:MAG: mevalonate kinase [Armatimonadetes bacterium]|nr:mevalonate kinase [Armatimonadota bacterium]
MSNAIQNPKSKIQNWRAVAPGKTILFGEHAINLGQAALSAGVGLYATCRVTETEGEGYAFRSGNHEQNATRKSLLSLAKRVDAYREGEDYQAIQALAAEDYFAPSKYILASAFGEKLPPSLRIEWESEIPSSSGLGSGGAAFTALVAAVSPLIPDAPTMEQRAAWAHRGDIIAHGGVASALDTQTSLFGGVIRYTGRGLAERIPYAPGLSILIGDTGAVAATSAVNGQVREWLAAKPESRMRYFETIGALGRAALPLMERGEWEELGRLFTLNQLVLEKIGVSCPEIEALVEAALGAGAYGAKLSGSGGGGIVIALVSEETKAAVAEAMRAAGGTAYTPEVGVPGVCVV